MALWRVAEPAAVKAARSSDLSRRRRADKGTAICKEPKQQLSICNRPNSMDEKEIQCSATGRSKPQGASIDRIYKQGLKMVA